MESRDVVAQQPDVVVEDAGSGGTALDMDKLTREALVNLLAPFSSGAGASATEIGSVEACQDAWQAAEQLPPAEAATAMEASRAVWPGGVPDEVQQTHAWKAAETAAAQETQHGATAQQQVRSCDPSRISAVFLPVAMAEHIACSMWIAVARSPCAVSARYPPSAFACPVKRVAP